MERFSSVWSLLFAAVTGIPYCFASETAPAAAGPNLGTSSSVPIAELVRQLDSPRFAERTESSRRLDEAGKEAFPALAEAALGDSREAAVRAIEILRKHSQEGDEATTTAAKESLQKIAASDHAFAARRAKDALNPPQPTPTVPNIQLGPIIPNLPFGAQQIQLQIQVNAMGGNQARRIQINNGVKQTEVTENDVKVKITEDANGGIQMEVTSKKDGKQTTEKYSAKNADELKKKHPGAGKLYERYGQQLGGGIQIRAVPAVPGARQAVPAPPRPK